MGNTTLKLRPVRSTARPSPRQELSIQEARGSSRPHCGDSGYRVDYITWCPVDKYSSYLSYSLRDGNQLHLKDEEHTRGLESSSLVKSNYCSSTGPQSDFQHVAEAAYTFHNSSSIGTQCLCLQGHLPCMYTQTPALTHSSMCGKIKQNKTNNHIQEEGMTRW